MKPIIFSIMVVALAVSGCHSPSAPEDPFPITAEEQRMLDAVVVVAPKTTPYDGQDSRQRQAYLESYAESYRQHMVGMEGSFRHKNSLDSLTDAKTRGWYQAQMDVKAIKESRTSH